MIKYNLFFCINLFFCNYIIAQSFEGEIKYRFKMQTENENIKKVFPQIQSENFDLLFKEDRLREMADPNYIYYLEMGGQDYSVNPQEKKILQTDWQGKKQQEPKLIRTAKDSVILNKKCTLYLDENNSKTEYWITDEIQPNVKGAKNLIFRGKGIVLYQKLITQYAIIEFQAEQINPKIIDETLFELPKKYKKEKIQPPKMNNLFPNL